jgi:hypothetical protein
VSLWSSLQRTSIPQWRSPIPSHTGAGPQIHESASPNPSDKLFTTLLITQQLLGLPLRTNRPTPHTRKMQAPTTKLRHPRRAGPQPSKRNLATTRQKPPPKQQQIHSPRASNDPPRRETRQRESSRTYQTSLSRPLRHPKSQRRKRRAPPGILDGRQHCAGLGRLGADREGPGRLLPVWRCLSHWTGVSISPRRNGSRSRRRNPSSHRRLLDESRAQQDV